MEEFVQLNISTYDGMREDLYFYRRENESLYDDVKDLKEENIRIIKKVQAREEKLHNLIMNYCLAKWKFSAYDLEKLINIDSYNFAFDNKKELLELGFTKDEMIEFIKEKYSEWELEKGE